MRIFGFLLGLIMGTSLLCAESPLVAVTLRDGDSFTVESQPNITIYELSERAMPIVRAQRKGAIAADYATGTLIRTENPRLAIQEITRQIAEQTGRSISKVRNSHITAIEPVLLLLAIGEKSTWNLLLTPKGDSRYVLSLTCVIDE